MTSLNQMVTVCRDPSGNIACSSTIDPLASQRWGYDCCVSEADGYQCYWFADVPRPPPVDAAVSD
jgi:hypothetical protein